MSQVSKPNLQKYFDHLVLTKQYQTCSNNSYQYLKRQVYKNNSQWPIQYIMKTTKNVVVTDKVKQRLNKIKNLPEHDNLVPVVAKGYKKIGGEQPRPTQIYVLSQYFNGAQNLSSIIEDHRQIRMSNINSIFYQIIRAMVFLQQNGVNHLRLNPSSILIKFPNYYSQENPMVRICDLGLTIENNYFYKYCLHEDFFKNINPYELPFNSCIKYDIWAFGVLIYYTLKQRQPFFGSISWYDSTKQFKLNYLMKPEEWIVKKDNNFSRGFLLQKTIVKCWGLNQQPVFRSWNEILIYYEQEFRKTRIEKMPVHTIFTYHIRLMFVFSQIFILMREQIRYKTSIIWQIRSSQWKQQNQNLMLKISESLIRISSLYHNIEFEKYFKNRCQILCMQYKIMLKQIKESLENQMDQLAPNSRFEQKQYTLDQLIFRIQNPIIKFKYFLQECRTTSKSYKLKLIEKFLDQLLSCCQKSKSILSDNTKQRCEILFPFYQSKVFQQMAENDFDFQVPKKVQIINQ